MFFLAVLMAFLSHPAFADVSPTPTPTESPITSTSVPTSPPTSTPTPNSAITTTPTPIDLLTVTPTIPISVMVTPTSTVKPISSTPTPTGVSITPTPTSTSDNGNSSPSPSPTGVVQAASVSTTPTPTPQPIAKAVASTLNDVSNTLYSDVIKFPTSFFSHPEQQYYKNSSLSKKITISLLVISAMLFTVGVLLLLPERIFWNWKRIKIQIIREKVKTWRYALASLL